MRLMPPRGRRQLMRSELLPGRPKSSDSVDSAPRRYLAEPRGLRANTGAGGWVGSVLVLSRVAEFYNDTLPTFARGTLVDLGCGTSPLRPFYRSMVDHAWGIDWPSGLHDSSVDLFADLNVGLPLGASSVDTVILSDVLEHLRRPGLLIEEARRVMRPNGHVIGTVPFMYWLHEEPYDYFRFTEHGLRSLFTEAGFRHVDVHVLGGGGDVLIDTLGKLLANVPLLGPSVARWIVRGWMALSCTAPMARLNGRAARSMPLEYGFVASP
jgi:SAM-dependent methyltransferase